MIFAWGFTWVPWFFMLCASLPNKAACRTRRLGGATARCPGLLGLALHASSWPRHALQRTASAARTAVAACGAVVRLVPKSPIPRRPNPQHRSGFVLTHARMRSTDPTRRQDVKVFVQKRLAVIYPMYALSLLLALLVQWWRGRALPSWWAVLSQGVLAQSWLPWLPEQALQLHCSAKP